MNEKNLPNIDELAREYEPEAAANKQALSAAIDHSTQTDPEMKTVTVSTERLFQLYRLMSAPGAREFARKIGLLPSSNE